MIHKHRSQQKAIDHAKYLNFLNRNSNQTFGVIPHLKEDYIVCSKEFADDIDIPFIDFIPTNYADMDFEHIKAICSDGDPLKHWEQLSGAFATLDGELLRFVLTERIPLRKLIKYELGSRGYDEKGRWIGFDKSEVFWQK